jgi:WD40 repeat protein
VSVDESGEVRIGPIGGGELDPDRTIHAKAGMDRVKMDADGSTIVAAQWGAHATPDVAYVWGLNGPPDADPLVLRNGDALRLDDVHIESSGPWLATADNRMGVLWALSPSVPRLLRPSRPGAFVAFTPDGKWLASASGRDGTVRQWPLSPAVGPRQRTLLEEKDGSAGVAMSPNGHELLATIRHVGQPGSGQAFLIPLGGGKPRLLPRFSATWLEAPAFSADGRLAAAGARQGAHGCLVELWDLDSWSVRALDSRVGDETCGWGKGFEGAVFETSFTSDGRLLTAGTTGLRLWDLQRGMSTLLKPCRARNWPRLAASPVDRFLLAEVDENRISSLVSVHDLKSNTSWELTSHGNRVTAVALDPTGKVAVTGDFDGVVRVGPASGEEPHLLFGHRLIIRSVAVSPDGRWIASGSQDGTIRLWPMPKGRPFHALPYEEMIARLRSFTNLRVVRDSASADGYRLEAGAFPGWKTIPDW